MEAHLKEWHQLFWPVITLGIFVLAAVVIYLNRRGIRARFRRNMPRGYVRPDWPSSPPLPPPTPRQVQAALDRGERERFATQAEARALRIREVAEQVYVRHLRDPEQAYADAVRWVDSRVAVALAACEDPRAKGGAGWVAARILADRGDHADAPPILCPVCYSLKFSVTGAGKFCCSNCGAAGDDYFERAARFVFCQKHGDPYPIGGQCPLCRPPISLRCPEHAEDYPPDGACPICADPERRREFDAGIEAARARRAASLGTEGGTSVEAQPIIASVGGMDWRIDPEAETPTARGGEDGCLVRFNGEAFEFEVPASYVYPPDLPVAVADALRAAWLEAVGDGPAEASGVASMAWLDHPVFTAAPQIRIAPSGTDTERILTLAGLLQDFDAHQLLNLAQGRDPELAARLTVGKIGGRLRRMAEAGSLIVAAPGKPGKGGRLPTYRTVSGESDDAIPAETIDAEGTQDAAEESPLEAPHPTQRSPRAATARCMVHGRDFPEGSICPKCLSKPRIPSGPARVQRG